MSFEDRYKMIKCLGSGMKGITYLVYDKEERKDVVAKLVEYDDHPEQVYNTIHSTELKCFVKPINRYYTAEYPIGYEYPPSDDITTEGWLIYTMPVYQELQLNILDNESKIKYFTAIFREYAFLQEHYGFCQGGDIGGNMMFGELNDHSETGIIVIDLDDCYFRDDKIVQMADSSSFIEAFEFTNNSQELSDLLCILRSIPSSEWNL